MSIKASELRIGNSIYYKTVDLDTGQEVFNVIEATSNDIKSIEMGVPNSYFPIPLTEEWLLGFGITDLNSIPQLGGDIFIELQNNEVGICGSDSCTSGTIYYAKCEYVHQLQNLYFALTGEELIANEEQQ